MTENQLAHLTRDLLRTLRALSPENQQKVLEFALSLQKAPEPPGSGGQGSPPGQSLLGIFSNLAKSLSPEDMAEARREMWGNFPRPVPGGSRDDS